MKKALYGLLAILFIGFSCTDEDDDIRIVPSNLEIRDFVWRGMNFFYLYKDNVPDLADDRFATDEDYEAYLASFDSPEDLFNDVLFLPGDEDQFSFIVSSRAELDLILQGTGLSSGVEFGLVRFPNDDTNIFAIVRYILPNSNAASTSLQRGDIITRVGGVQLTDSNFGGLLFGDDTSITYGLATFDGATVTDTAEEVTVQKAIITENPIFIADVLNIGGQNIGYLMYNGFRRNFDEQLNDVFGNFVANGVTDLVLDLRYNGGGSVSSATTLASMITGQFAGQVFSTEQWNSDLQARFEANQPEQLVNNFVTSTVNPDTNEFDRTPLNSLNLNRVFVLTTGSSASASELIINSLSPYINVVQIGTQTRGKFQASTTVFDSEVPDGRSDFNDFNDGEGVTSSHEYIMQPLILVLVNADGVSEFAQGLRPDLELREDFANFGVLGDPSEPLLARAIQEITGGGVTPSAGTSRISNFSIQLEEIQYKRAEMYIDKTFTLKDFQ